MLISCKTSNKSLLLVYLYSTANKTQRSSRNWRDFHVLWFAFLCSDVELQYILDKGGYMPGSIVFLERNLHVLMQFIYFSEKVSCQKIPQEIGCLDVNGLCNIIAFIYYKNQSTAQVHTLNSQTHDVICVWGSIHNYGNKKK